jgi:hypothetical protein
VAGWDCVEELHRNQEEDVWEAKEELDEAEVIDVPDKPPATDAAQYHMRR